MHTLTPGRQTPGSGKKRKKLVVQDGLVQTRLNTFFLKFPNLRKLPSAGVFTSTDQGPCGPNSIEENEKLKRGRVGEQMEGPNLHKRLKLCMYRDPNDC